MNIDRLIRTPYHTLPITMALKSVDRKVYRDVHCIECGRPYLSMSDKYVSIIDAAVPVQMLRRNEMLLGVRCGNHTCKQRYQVYL